MKIENTQDTITKFQRSRHGDPVDRGAADSYYRRSRNPHYYEGPTGFSRLVTEAEMTADEIAAYHAGFDENEAEGDFKDYGWGGDRY